MGRVMELATLALAMTMLAPTSTRARAPITAFTWQGTVGGARYPNVTSCGPTECDLLQPMPWLSLPTHNASVSAKALVHELRALPAGRRTIMMRTHTASFIDTDPRDFVARPALRAACTGADAKFANFSALWWDHGAAALKLRVFDFITAFRSAAGSDSARLLEFVGLDTERGMGIWGSYNHDSACAQARWRAVTDDARWPTVRATLEGFGLRMDSADPDGLQHAVDAVASLGNATVMRSREVWDAYTNRRMTMYYRRSVFEPLLAAFPELSAPARGG
jgi:hypothetical protein